MKDQKPNPFDGLPLHDVDSDPTLSQRRKDACKVDYQDMLPEHLDKIFTSCYLYDKKTGEPVAKKPRSMHELIWCMLKSQMVISEHVLTLEAKINELETKLNGKKTDESQVS